MGLTLEELSLQPDETLHAVTKYNMEAARCAETLVDEICAFERTDFGDIVSMLAHHLELRDAEELACVIKVMFDKAMAQPTHAETCARVLAAAKACYPQFPPENEGRRPTTFTRVLLTVCQKEFESQPLPSEGFESMKRLMSFIGHLFMQQLLVVKVIAQPGRPVGHFVSSLLGFKRLILVFFRGDHLRKVAHDLIGIRPGQSPEEPAVECVIEMLHLIGPTMDQQSLGKSLMNAVTAQLRDLAGLRRNGNHVFSQQLRSAVDELLEWRRRSWDDYVGAPVPAS